MVDPVVDLALPRVEMEETVKADRDLRWAQILMLFLIAANLGMIISGIYHHRWLDAIAATLWMCNCAVVLTQFKLQQITRDRAREVEAMLYAAVRGELEGMK